MKAIRTGHCHKCGKSVYLDKDGNAVEDYLPTGDWDWVCYPCQYKMMDNGIWQNWKERQLADHNGSGKCTH